MRNNDTYEYEYNEVPQDEDIYTKSEEIDEFDE